MSNPNGILKAIRFVFTIPVIIYRRIISPLIPGRCIYTPSCSLYTQQAIMKHGIIKGIMLGIMRVGRCHSMFTGGDDPVPEHVSWKQVKYDYRQFRDKD
jgi:putative membrane protein insertion efficiency factor